MKTFFKLLTTGLFFTLSTFSAEKFSNENFKNLLESKEKFLIHVHADWCPTCKVQQKVLNKNKDTIPPVLEVNFDKDKKFKKEYKVFQQSMLIAFSNGKEQARVFGKTKEKDIMSFIDNSLSKSASLQDVLDEKKNSGAKKKSKKVKMTMSQATQKLEDSGILKQAKARGQEYIDFTLTNIKGEKVTLSEKLKNGPVILTFYRGGWCPYCNLQLKAYQDRLSDFESAGGQLIAISPEKPEAGDETATKNELKFEVLSDIGNKVAKKYGLVFQVEEDLKEVYLSFGIDLDKNQGDSSKWELPLAATYVIDKDGKIAYSFLNVDYVKRAEPNDIIESLKGLK